MNDEDLTALRYAKVREDDEDVWRSLGLSTREQWNALNADQQEAARHTYWGKAREFNERVKTPERTMHWVNVCMLIDKSTRDGTAKEMLLAYAKEQRDLAASEGYDDTAQYIQHVIDDVEERK